MIDSHSHIYAEEFDADRPETVLRAKEAGIEHIILPNCDSSTLGLMLKLEAEYPGYCHACIGLHPTSIKENFREELNIVSTELKKRKWLAVGEIGIDLYWDKTYLQEQINAFQQQIEWALSYDLPVIIHVRDSLDETMEALRPYKNSGLTGVFHSFTGTLDQANRILDFGGFLLGINGIVTFKNSGLAGVLENIDIKHILTETDAPYLTPAPFRGKRNESAYVQLVVNKLAEIYHCTIPEIDEQVTLNAKKLFRLEN